MINIDINQSQNRNQNRQNVPLDTTDEANHTRDIEEELDETRDLDYYLDHHRIIPIRNTQPEEENIPGNLSGIPRFMANVTSEWGGFGGVSLITPLYLHSFLPLLVHIIPFH